LEEGTSKYRLNLGKYETAIASGKDIVLVYTDEWYIHTTLLARCVRCFSVPKGDSLINKSASKGKGSSYYMQSVIKGLSVKEFQASLLVNWIGKETDHIQESNMAERSPLRCFFGW
jgi:hypothetical protein